MTFKLFDRVKVNTSTSGTGDVTFGSVVSNAFYTPAEMGAVDTDTVRYVIVDGTDVEEGIGTIGGSVTTMARTTVTKSKISGTAGTTKLNLSGTAVVAFIASAADILIPVNNLSDLASAPTALTNLGGTTVGKALFTATDAAAARAAVTTGAFSAHKNSVNQTGITGDGSTVTQLTFGSALFSDGSLSSSSYTPPAGKIRLSAQAYITGTFSAGNIMVLSIYKNGTAFKESFFWSPKINEAMPLITILDDASGTDVYTVRLRGNASSGTLTVNGDPKWTFWMGCVI